MRKLVLLMGISLGLSLFTGFPEPCGLELIEATPYDNGAVLHRYRPVAAG